MICPSSMGVRLCMAIIGALGSEVEQVPQAVRPAGVSGAAGTMVVAGSAIDRRPEGPELERILERLALRSREVRSVQVRFKLTHTSRLWGETVKRGEGRLVLDKGKFGVMDFVESDKSGGEPRRFTDVWTRESFSFACSAEKSAFTVPREHDDGAWMPPDLKLPFFFDTNVAEMAQAYRFALDKPARQSYTLRVTPRAAETCGAWARASLVLDGSTLLPIVFRREQGDGEVDVYRALEIKVNEPIPDDIRAIADGSAWKGYTLEVIGPKHWMRRWFRSDRVDRAEPERAIR